MNHVWNKSQNPESNLTTSKRLSFAIALVLAGLMINGCAKKSSTEQESDDSTITSAASGGGGTGTDVSIPLSVPSDSTGALGTAIFSFQNGATESLNLAAPQLDIGNGIVITTAKMSIRSIKLKSEVSRTSEEKAMKAKEREEAEKETAETKAPQEEFKKRLELEKKQLEIELEAATTELDRKALEATWETAKSGYEAEMATMKKAFEDAKAAREGSRDKNIRWIGPYVFDALTGLLDQDLAPTSVVDGSYKRIEFKLAPSNSVLATDPLINRSFVVAGTVVVNGVVTPYMVSFGGTEEIRLGGSGHAKIIPDVSNSLVMAFDLTHLFDGVDLSSASVDKLGVITIDEDHNASQLEKLRKNLRSKSRFGKDVDGDGAIATSEVAGNGESAEAEDASTEK